MPHRNLDLLLGIGGLLAMGWILIRGRNLHAEAQKGGRRFRRSLRAGLALLALLGIPWPAVMGEEVASVTKTLRSDETLDRYPEGRHLRETWKEADEILSGKRGMYPFDEAGKKSILSELQVSLNDIDALTGRGAWLPEEGQLLKTELGEAIRGVQAKRPSEMQMATCYKPMMFHPGLEATRRLSARLPLLAKIPGGTLSPLVREKVLQTVHRDVALLEKRLADKVVPVSEIEDTRQAIDQARRVLERLGSKPASATPDPDNP